mmetsp:Transcript_39905/g.76320  ORF Transcript_39905/g.76320 Transcript_39905/m.76320 type:complete len:144 (-) Transcript_39905:176-607(-)
MAQVVRDLHKAGHVIVIYTTRELKSQADSVAGAANDVGITTINSLHEFKIPYNELYFGKPSAHFYVDSLAVDPLRTHQTVAKQTGFHPTLVKAKFMSSHAHVPQHTQKTEKPRVCFDPADLAIVTLALAFGCASGLMISRMWR